MAQNIIIAGESYNDVPAISVSKTSGGKALFVDISDTTAEASDVFSGKYYYKANGEKVEGGVTPSSVPYIITETPDSRGGIVLEVSNAIDLTEDTVSQESLLEGFTAHDHSGVKIIGTAKAESPPELVMGAIRPDATVWKEYVRDSLLVVDDGYSLPGYYTSTYYIENNKFDDINILPDIELYDYFVSWYGLIYPIYNTAVISAGRQEYYMTTGYKELDINVPVLPLSGDITKENSFMSYNGSHNIAVTTYWASSTAFRVETNVGYGFRIEMPNMYITKAAAGSPDVMLRITAPTISVRGSSTYLSKLFYDAITDVRCQYKIKVWRSPKNNLNLDGWGAYQLSKFVSDCAASPTHTLL